MADTTIQETEFTVADGTRLFSRHYGSGRTDECRNVVIVHGMSEHGGRYDHVARLFVEAGWNVIVPDQRGHGLSGGTRTHVDRFDQFVDDLAAVLDHYRLPAASTGILAHSMGSLVAIRFAERYPERVAAMVLLAPLLGIRVQVSAMTIAIGRLISMIYPKIRYSSRIKARDTTRSESVVQERFDDPLIERTITAGCYFELLRAIRLAHDDAARLTVPLFVLQGAEDHIVNPNAVEPWLNSTSASIKKFSWLPEHYHELHQEPDYLETLQAVLQWLTLQVAVTEAETLESPG